MSKTKQPVRQVADFLSQATFDSANQRVKVRDLYAAYRAWCEMRVSHPLSETAFGRAMSVLGIDRDDGRERSYVGINLHPTEAKPARAQDDNVSVPRTLAAYASFLLDIANNHATRLGVAHGAAAIADDNPLGINDFFRRNFGDKDNLSSASDALEFAGKYQNVSRALREAAQRKVECEAAAAEATASPERRAA